MLPERNYVAQATAIRNYVVEATAILQAIKDHDIPQRPSYRQPYTVLTALLTHAPSQSAQNEIAKDIVHNAADEDGLVQLTDFFWTALLVPCNPSFFGSL